MLIRCQSSCPHKEQWDSRISTYLCTASSLKMRLVKKDDDVYFQCYPQLSPHEGHSVQFLCEFVACKYNTQSGTHEKQCHLLSVEFKESDGIFDCLNFAYR